MGHHVHHLSYNDAFHRYTPNINGVAIHADVVTVLLVILRGAAAEEIIGVDISGIGGVGDGGEEIAVGFVCPCNHCVIGIGEGEFEIGAGEIFPAEAIGFGDTTLNHKTLLIEARFQCGVS